MGSSSWAREYRNNVVLLTRICGFGPSRTLGIRQASCQEEYAHWDPEVGMKIMFRGKGDGGAEEIEFEKVIKVPLFGVWFGVVSLRCGNVNGSSRWLAEMLFPCRSQSAVRYLDRFYGSREGDGTASI